MKFMVMTFFVILPSCAWLPRKAPIPIERLVAGSKSGGELVIFLPGRWSRVAEFERECFFEIAAKRWPDARLVAPDLHLGYYRNMSVARRLHEDVILPARRSGVTEVRLVGISMGGLGALIYDVEYPNQVDELILLSPFVGEEMALKEIEAAGGLKNWQPGNIAQRDYTRKLWLKLRASWLENGARPKVVLGCGLDDRLAASNRLFEREFLGAGDGKWIAGGHDWPTWRLLFESSIEK